MCVRTRPHARARVRVLYQFSSFLVKVYPLARSRSHSRLCLRSRYTAISLVIESERECTGANADAHVDTLLKPTSHCPILKMLSACLLSDKNQLRNYWFKAGAPFMRLR